MVRRFDTSAAAGFATAQHGIPEAGVYLYDTTGSEHVNVLGGATHEYPSVTTITVTSTSCGFNWRWDALAERWEESRVCVEPFGEELRSFTSYHEFFGQADHRDFQCAPGSIARPSSSRIGLQWTTHCDGAGASSSGYGENIGVESLCVGGRQLEVLHFRETITNEGATRGASEHDVWVMPDSGLIVRRAVRMDTDSDSLIGTAHYREEYTIQLRSLEPVPVAAADGDKQPVAEPTSC